jgi:hypothetical protein
MSSLIVLILMIFCGCNSESSHPSLAVKKDSSFTIIAQQFGLGAQLDSSFLFYGNRPFDTSFALLITVDSNGGKGVYCEVNPTYHNNINEFAIEENQLLFLESYSFKINDTVLKEVHDQATALLNNDSTYKTNKACRDCPEFGLSYNGRQNIDNNIKYEPFYGYLKQLFLSKFIATRKPIMKKN